MVKNYILRHQLYKEETRVENILNQQVSIIVEYDCKPMDIYSASRNNGLLVCGELIQKNVIKKGTSYLNIYVKDEKLALELAERWANEPKQKEGNYRVYGVDKYYYIFN